MEETIICNLCSAASHLRFNIKGYIQHVPSYTHNYKYLEIPILIISGIITKEEKQMLAWNLPRFYSYL